MRRITESSHARPTAIAVSCPFLTPVTSEDRSEVDLAKEGTDHTCPEITRIHKSKAPYIYEAVDEIAQIEITTSKDVKKINRKMILFAKGRSPLWPSPSFRCAISQKRSKAEHSGGERNKTKYQKPCLGRAANECRFSRRDKDIGARATPARGPNTYRSFARRTVGRASRGCTRRRDLRHGDGKRGIRRRYLSPSDCNEIGRQRERGREEDGEPSRELGEKLMKNIKIRRRKGARELKRRRSSR